MSESEKPPFEKFYRCVKIITGAWKSKDGYEYDADRAMAKIDDLIAEGKFEWNEEKISEELADFFPEEKEEILASAYDDKKPHEKGGTMFKSRSNLLFIMFLFIIFLMVMYFLFPFFFGWGY